MRRYTDELGNLDFDEDIYEEYEDFDVEDSYENIENLREWNSNQRRKKKVHNKFNESEDVDDFDYVQSLTELPIFKTEVDGEKFEVNLWDLGRGKRSNFRDPAMQSPRGINALERNALDREEAKCVNYEKERIKDLKRTADILSKRFNAKNKTNPRNLDMKFKYEK